MDIHIKRGQEFKKGSLLSGKNVKLTLEVDVALSEQDKRLIEQYYDPSVSSSSEIKQRYEGAEDAYKAVKVDHEESKLSKFHLVAYVDDGHTYLGNIRKFETAVVQALVKNLEQLEALDQWQGEKTLSSREE